MTWISSAMVSKGLRRHWHTSLFHEPQLLLRHLKQEPPFWEALHAWIQQQIVRKWSGSNCFAGRGD